MIEIHSFNYNQIHQVVAELPPRPLNYFFKYD